MVGLSRLHCETVIEVLQFFILIGISISQEDISEQKL